MFLVSFLWFLVPEKPNRYKPCICGKILNAVLRSLILGNAKQLINMGLTLTEKSLKLIIAQYVPLKRQVLHKHLSDALSIQESLEMCKPWVSCTAPVCLYSLDLLVGHCPQPLTLDSFEINFSPFPPAPNQVQNLYPTSWPWGRNAPRWALLTL